jgi:hypothetical protein
MDFTRRFTLGSLFGGEAILGGTSFGLAAAPGCVVHSSNWARGVEGQRKADLSDGTFLNPIVPRNHPDPSILKDGKDSFGVQMEVSGYHHNVAYDFLNLRPALYVAGKGEAGFRNLIHHALI